MSTPFVRVLGGGWITADGYGTRAEGLPSVPDARVPVIPPSREVFPKPLTRYGRFDEFTKLGCAATALALREAGLAESEEKRPIGFILSSGYECYTTDLRYYDTTLEEGGLYTSPNLFSYTLPGVVIGECAAYFKLTGPTFVVGDNPGPDSPVSAGFGTAALEAAALQFEAGFSDPMLVGWIDSPPGILAASDDASRGALVIILQRVSDDSSTPSSIPIERLYGLDLVALFRLE